MKLTITSTDLLTEIGGVPVRAWRGLAEDGTECTVFVHRVAVATRQDTTAFDRELSEVAAPENTRVVDLRQVL